MSPRRARLNVALAAWCALLLAAMVWPGYALFGARIEPFVLGLPFSVFWVAAWVALTFVAMCVYDALAHGDGRE